MSEGASLAALGLFLLVGNAAHGLGRRMHVPRVTLLLQPGLLAGPTVLDLVPDEVSRWFPLVGRMSWGPVTHGRLQAAGETGRRIDPDEGGISDSEAPGESASPPGPRP